ncbi:hypothetical protein V8G54_004159, partial [Vigna mungo]
GLIIFCFEKVDSVQVEVVRIRYRRKIWWDKEAHMLQSPDSRSTCSFFLFPISLFFLQNTTTTHYINIIIFGKCSLLLVSACPRDHSPSNIARAFYDPNIKRYILSKPQKIKKQKKKHYFALSIVLCLNETKLTFPS